MFGNKQPHVTEAEMRKALVIVTLLLAVLFILLSLEVKCQMQSDLISKYQINTNSVYDALKSFFDF
jgi:preprotein translocase subunit SecG